METSKIAIITPVKNEIKNLQSLFNTIKNQSINIYSWIIIENDCDDGSNEFLLNIKQVENVKNFHLLHLSFEDKSYQLGMKYSTIIKYGFDFIKSTDYYNKLDFIGILDSDCFPELNYYENLTNFMNSDNKIGLASGVLILESGVKGFSNSNHVRGSGRLWKKACFDEAGYYIGMSADSISRTKAIILGWDAKVDNTSYFISREANSRVSLEYGGKSAYYNGYTFSYAIFKTLYYLLRKPKQGVQYLKGYFKAFFNKFPKNPDLEIIYYNKKMLRRKLFKFIK